MSLAIVGATSKVGIEVARVFASEGHDLLLISRDTSELIEELDLVSTTNHGVRTLNADVSSLKDITTIERAIIESFDDNPYVVFAVGALFAESGSPDRDSHFLEVIDVNFRHVALIMETVAAELESRGTGCIVALSSVAGDRGRKSNYIYGSAKAGLNAFCQGLRNRLATAGVHVLTVKLGYVDTPMFRRALGEKSADVPRVLVGRPDDVAQKIAKAAWAKKNVVYIGQIWRVVMLIIRLIPESLFKRLDL